MLVLDQLARISPDEVRSRVTRDGKSWEFSVRFSQHGESLRTLDLEGLPPAVKWELSNSDEFRAFLKTVCAFADGAPVALPQEIVSDLPTESREIVEGKGAGTVRGDVASGKRGKTGGNDVSLEVSDHSLSPVRYNDQ